MSGPEFEGVLLARMVVDEESGCHRWTGTHTPNRYGQMYVGGVTYAVHRVAHEVWIGPIPEGLEVDHVWDRGCRHRDCINPDHLEAVTHAENSRRAAAKITHCAQGHEFTPENTAITTTKANGNTRRNCRACWAMRRQAKVGKPPARFVCPVCHEERDRSSRSRHFAAKHPDLATAALAALTTTDQEGHR